MDFTGKVALVTGAGKTIGRGYAEWLGKHGAKVVVNNRSHPGVPSSAQEVADVINAAGGAAIIDEHAVEDESSGKAMVQRAIDTFGRLDILICNAAITSEKKPLEELSLAEFNAIMQINFYGSLYPLMAALPGMIERNYGRIVLTTSVAGLCGMAGSVAYAASKTALVGVATGYGNRQPQAQHQGQCCLALCADQHVGAYRPEVFRTDGAHTACTDGRLDVQRCVYR